MSPRIREPFNGLTHLAGVILSIIGLVLLLVRAVHAGSVRQVVSFALFGSSLITLYSSSSLYHLLDLSERANKRLRRLDHMMIFVLIAGTYAPLCLVTLGGAVGWRLFGAVLGVAVCGIAMKALWMGAPRWFSTLLYLGMGWLVVLAAPRLAHVLGSGGVWWLVGGGFAYSLGAVVYAAKWPNITRGFGFHELWHLFVMAGSACTFWLIFNYVARVGG